MTRILKRDLSGGQPIQTVECVQIAEKTALLSALCRQSPQGARGSGETCPGTTACALQIYRCDLSVSRGWYLLSEREQATAASQSAHKRERAKLHLIQILLPVFGNRGEDLLPEKHPATRDNWSNVSSDLTAFIQSLPKV